MTGTESTEPAMEAAEVKALQARKEAAFRAFEAWEARHPPSLPKDRALAWIGGIWSLLPRKVRLSRSDPDYSGVRAMHGALAALGGSHDPA